MTRTHTQVSHLFTSLLLTFAIVTAAHQASVHAEFLTNGNFEVDLDSNGIPDNWTYTQGDSPNTTVLQSTITSPITNVYPAGTRAARLVDGTDASTLPLLEQTSSNFVGGNAVSGEDVIFSFDFYFDAETLSNQQWRAIVFGPSNTLIAFWDINVTNAVGVRTNDGTNINVTPGLAGETWYHLEATLLWDAVAGEYNAFEGRVLQGGVTDIGSWGPTTTFNAAASINTVRFADVTGGTTASTTLVLDNASLRVIPEPASLVLTAGGAILLMGRRRPGMAEKI